MQDARDLIADARNQQKRFAAIEPLVAQRLAVLSEVVALRRARGEGAAAQSILTDKGKSIMDEIRRIIGEMIDEENALLKQRDQSAKATARFAISSMVFGVL